MTDTTARIPTDAEIVALAYDCSALPETITDATLLVFAHAVLAKWGAQPVAAPSVPARAPHDHIEDVRAMVQISVEPDEVLVAIKRSEGYEDVHPELVAADALPSTPFEYRVAWPLELEP